MTWQLFNAVIHETGKTAIEISGASLTILPATREGEELAGRLTIATGGEFVGRISSIALDGNDLIVCRAAFGGKVELETRHHSGHLIATSNEPLAGAPELPLAASSLLSLECVPIAARDAVLEGARIVVSGGRGLDASDFDQLQKLALCLGGALGGSLPAVDLGLVPVSRQIGQSGKFVTPEIYVAVGLSGTPQHLAGIGAATRIIAINKDPKAPIFQFAEAGAIGDAKEILPLLLAALSSLLSHV